jgi:Ribbon-helix-helix protein, copG family.
LSAQVNFRIPDDLYARAQEVARENGTTVSRIVKDALRDYTKEGSSVEERLKKLEEAVRRLERQRK